MQTNMDLLRDRIANSKMTQDDFAVHIGMDPSTFYRKLKADGLAFTVGQMHKIAEVLGLSANDAKAIFFDSILA